MQESGPITTEQSADSGRLKVSVSCQHGKKKCLKCAIKDGKGGGGWSSISSFKDAFKSPKIKMPKMKKSKSFGGAKSRRIKTASLKSVLKSLTSGKK